MIDEHLVEHETYYGMSPWGIGDIRELGVMNGILVFHRERGELAACTTYEAAHAAMRLLEIE